MKGDPCLASNYRPITLLNTDYRLLSKVLAHRLGRCLPSLISPEQAAFLRGRSIGENAHLLQLLPHLLARHGRWALVAFCDFRKAYDTVHRGFLLAVLRQLGLGDGFVSWVQLLLPHTLAAAAVNGCVSRPALFLAGVRQGCPLAPLLYLCLAQALLRLLQARGVGIQAAGLNLAALQLADDCEALLEGGTPQQTADRVQSFLAAMATFAAASGQHLAPEKTHLLPIGSQPPAPLPPAIHGLQVVPTAEALGLQFHAGTQPATANWQPRLQRVEAAHEKLASLGLLAFGRGFGSAAYGVSQLLYCCELAGFPLPAAVTRLSTITAKLVDRGLAPSDAHHAFAGVRAELLAGHPRRGGFGALPWQQHIHARHAAWAVRLALADPQRPWAAVASAVLRQVHPQLSPLHLLSWRPTDGAEQRLPPPLRRMWDGLRALPPLQQVAPPQPHAWCCAVPLWGNPLLRLPDGQPLASRFGDLAASSLRSIPALQAAHHQLQHLQPQQYTTALRVQLFGWAAADAFLDLQRTRDQLAALLAALPAGWADAAWAHLGSSSVTEADALAVLRDSLGWQLGDTPITLPHFRVRHGTQLQLQQSGLQQERLQRFAAFEALAAPGTPAVADGSEVARLLPRLWQLPWENQHKEVYWRLVLNGLALASRMHGSGPQPCACGSPAPQPDRRHHFWDCPVAAAVRSTLAAQLGGQQPSRQQLWLMRHPAGVHAGVWDAVCLAALAAMDGGRRQLAARLLQARQAADGPSSSRHPPPPPPTPAQLVPAAQRHAVARLWDLLQDLCTVGTAPAAWQQQLPAEHPFICWDVEAHRLRLHRSPRSACVAPRF